MKDPAHAEVPCQIEREWELVGDVNTTSDRFPAQYSSYIRYLLWSLWCGGFILLLGGWQLSQSGISSPLLAISFPNWEENCATDNSEPAFNLEGPYRATRSAQACRSEWFAPQGNELSIEYAGFPNFKAAHHGVFLERMDDRNGSIVSQRLLLPRIEPATRWKQFRLEIQKNFPSERFRVTLIQSAKASAWIAVRPGLEWRDSSTLRNTLRDTLRSSLVFPVLRLTLACWILCTVILIGCRSTRTNYSAVVALLAAASMIHFRPDVFFRDDEWRILERFVSLGPKAIFLSHNEHYIPLWLASYWLQVRTLGLSPALISLVSVATLTAVGFLLYKFIQTNHFSCDKDSHRLSSSIGIIAAVYFVSLGLHSEAIQWAAVQGQLMAIFCELAALRFLLAYSRDGSPGRLVAGCLLLVAAGLFFASALVAGIHALIAIALFRPGIAERMAKLSIGILLSMFFVGSVYFVGSGSSHPGTAAFSHSPGYLRDIGLYLWTGVNLGTLARGLSFSDGLSDSAVLRDLNSLLPGAISAGPTLLSWIPLAVICGLGLCYACGRNSSYSMRWWLFGMLWIVSSFALPAVGRAMLGAHHAMTLRYHSYSAVGLVWMLVPLIHYFLALSHRVRIGAAPFAALLLVHLAQQLSLSNACQLYWRDGARLSNWLRQVAITEKTRLNAGYQPYFYSRTGKQQTAPATLNSSQELTRILRRIGAQG